MDVRGLDWCFRSDVVVLVAAASEAGAPEIARSLGLQPSSNDRALTIYVPVPEGLAVLTMVAESRPIAVTVGRPRDYRSLQLKGNDAVITRTTAADSAWVARYRSEIGPSLEPTGVPPQLWEHVLSKEFVVVRFTPEGAWDQTPGSSAGQPIETSR